MITKASLLQLIVEETVIIKDALLHDSFELVGSSLERRKALIDELIATADFGDADEVERLTLQYEMLDKECLLEMERLSQIFSKERQENIAIMHDTLNKKNAYEKYSYFDLRE